jgi:anti-sigma B factor antagonist
MDSQNTRITGGGERAYCSRTEFIGEAEMLAVSGTLDLHAAPQFSRDIEQATAFSHQDLILDLSDLDLIDSSALCVMAGALQHLEEEDRRLILVVTRSHVMRILTITGLLAAFTIVASRRQALQLVAGRAADLARACSPRGQALRGAVA